jgi:hypothetical protein
MQQWPQGLWVVTPDGKVLAFHYHKPKAGESYADGQKRWLNDTIEMLRNAVKEAGTLPLRELKTRPDPLADRGHGTGTDGGNRLAVTVVPLRNGRQDGAPVVDSVRLTGEQWTAFLPPAGKVTAGQDWTVPEATARLFTPALSPMTDPIFSPTPRDVTLAKISAKVERVTGTVAVIRYSAQWETAHNRDGDPKFPIRTTANGDGVGVFDTQTGKMTAMMWILGGSYRNGPSTEKPQPTAAIVEWTAEK